MPNHQTLTKGIDYYLEEKGEIKYKVFTEHYHYKKGFCCNNKCRHCPYVNKKSLMKKTSLEEFNSIVDQYYLSLKKYIVSSDNEKVVLEDYENFAWRQNPDLKSLFEYPSILPVKNIEVVYKEKLCLFIITIYLK